MSGPMLVNFFNEFGFNDVYSWGGGFPTRRYYAADQIRSLNGTQRIEACIVRIVDSRRFIDTNFDVSQVVEYLNQYLRHDGYEMVPWQMGYTVQELAKPLVDFDLPFKASTPEMEAFIDQQVEKCETKLSGGDYDGAITNARSFVESILIDLECRLVDEPPNYNGDLPKLYKRVRKRLNMDDSQYKELEPVLQLLRGLISVIDGLSGISNKMGDRHARARRPASHHATLAVNAARTLCNFLVSSYVRQFGTGSAKGETTREARSN